MPPDRGKFVILEIQDAAIQYQIIILDRQKYFDQKTKIKFICPDPKGSKFDFSQNFDLKTKLELT